MNHEQVHIYIMKVLKNIRWWQATRHKLQSRSCFLELCKELQEVGSSHQDPCCRPRSHHSDHLRRWPWCISLVRKDQSTGLASTTGLYFSPSPPLQVTRSMGNIRARIWESSPCLDSVWNFRANSHRILRLAPLQRGLSFLQIRS